MLLDEHEKLKALQLSLHVVAWLMANVKALFSIA
jgi:hypothetical protein